MGTTNEKIKSFSVLEAGKWFEVSNEVNSIFSYSNPYCKRTIVNHTNDLIVEEYQVHFRCEEEYHMFLSQLPWRKRQLEQGDSFIYPVTFFQDTSRIQICSALYSGLIYLQKVEVTMKEVSQIPFIDVFYILKAIISGFKELYDKFGYMLILEDMIFIDRKGQIKVWINPNLSLNQPNIEEKIQPQFPQMEMITKIIKIAETNVQWSSQQLIFSEYISQKYKQQKLCFENVLELLVQYTNQNALTINNFITSIRQLYSEEISQMCPIQKAKKDKKKYSKSIKSQLSQKLINKNPIKKNQNKFKSQLVIQSLKNVTSNPVIKTDAPKSSINIKNCYPSLKIGTPYHFNQTIQSPTYQKFSNPPIKGQKKFQIQKLPSSPIYISFKPQKPRNIFNETFQQISSHLKYKQNPKLSPNQKPYLPTKPIYSNSPIQKMISPTKLTSVIKNFKEINEENKQKQVRKWMKSDIKDGWERATFNVAINKFKNEQNQRRYNDCDQIEQYRQKNLVVINLMNGKKIQRPNLPFPFPVVNLRSQEHKIEAFNSQGLILSQPTNKLENKKQVQFLQNGVVFNQFNDMSIISAQSCDSNDNCQIKQSKIYSDLRHHIENDLVNVESEKNKSNKKCQYELTIGNTIVSDEMGMRSREVHESKDEQIRDRNSLTSNSINKYFNSPFQRMIKSQIPKYYNSNNQMSEIDGDIAKDLEQIHNQ